MSQDNQLNLSRWLGLQNLEILGAELPPLRVSLRKKRSKTTFRLIVSLGLALLAVACGVWTWNDSTIMIARERVKPEKITPSPQAKPITLSPAVVFPSPSYGFSEKAMLPVLPVETTATVTVHNKPTIIKPVSKSIREPVQDIHGVEDGVRKNPREAEVISARDFHQPLQQQPLVISVKKTGGNGHEKAE